MEIVPLPRACPLLALPRLLPEVLEQLQPPLRLHEGAVVRVREQDLDSALDPGEPSLDQVVGLIGDTALTHPTSVPRASRHRTGHATGVTGPVDGSQRLQAVQEERAGDAGRQLPGAAPSVSPAPGSPPVPPSVGSSCGHPRNSQPDSDGWSSPFE